MTTLVYTDAQQAQMLRVIPDLVRHRHLLWDFVSKELRARYRNAMMGFLWAVLQPVLMMLILTLVFGYLLAGVVNGRGVQSGHSYAVFILCGLVPWQFLAISLMSAATSVLANQEIIKKVYFPREIIPIAAILNCVVNIAIGFITLLVVMSILDGVSSIGLGIIWIPLIFAIQLALVIGLGLFLAAMNVDYRDVGYLTEVVLAFGFYATPVFYDLPRNFFSTQPWLYRLYMVNPMADLIEAYRQAILSNRLPDLTYLAWPAVVALAALAFGIFIFRRNAPTFVDHL